MTGNAKYVLSNHKGNGTRAFNQTARFTREKWTNFENPAPGNYNLGSEFGVYGDSKYYKTLSNFKGSDWTNKIKFFWFVNNVCNF